MSPPWDVLGVGAAMGSVVGLYGGYQLHKLVLYVRDWKVWREERAAKSDKTIMLVEHRDPPPRANDWQELSAPIPMVRKRAPSPALQQERSANPDRDDVIAALMGSGYKKADANKAADACSLVERASGLQQWTIAALRNAASAK